MANENGIGASVKRTEDKRFLMGIGTYTDDISVTGQTYAVFVRSPHAHATIKGIDVSKAGAMPGIVRILTGADFALDELGGLICGWTVHSKDGSEMAQPPHPALAHEKVRYVGDQVAIVIAETETAARDGAEAVEVDYDVHDAVVDPAAAILDGAPQIHEEAPGNLCYDWEIGDKAVTDQAFADASHISKIAVTNNRLVPNAMEPRAAIGSYDKGTESYTLHTTSQNPHVARLILSAFIGIAPEHKLRVIAPDVGGGFGSKIFVYAEETVCLWASKYVDRPIKWTAGRDEAFLSDAHGRDHVSSAEMAMDADGKFLGLRVSTIANMGAYLSTFASAVPTYLYGTLLSGQYVIPGIYAEVKAVFTNTTVVDAYRGAGRPEATYILETLVNKAARDLDLSPAELRRRNFIKPDQFPYETPVILEYDVGDYDASLDLAEELVDVSGFTARRAVSEKAGKLRGLGLSTYIEACGIAPSQAVGSLGAGVGLWESAKVQFNATGSVTIYTGSHSHGQGHETTFAQIVSDKLGVPFEDIDVVHGDTDKVQFGMGTYGSRSVAVGGSAIVKASNKIVEKAHRIAAHMMEAHVDDVEFQAPDFVVSGTDKTMSIQEIAFEAYVPHNMPTNEFEPGLTETAFYDPNNFTFPAGAHLCEVEVDPDTGVVDIVKFVAVDDFGNVINPMIVEGQVHGGIAQGIGQALLEHGIYDRETGQLITGSYMDYAMPRADDLPSYTVGMTKTECPSNPLGVKGCGEAGAIAAPPAIMNAIIDAIGTDDIAMPATPQAIWRALRDKS